MSSLFVLAVLSIMFALVSNDKDFGGNQYAEKGGMEGKDQEEKIELKDGELWKELEQERQRKSLSSEKPEGKEQDFKDQEDEFLAHMSLEEKVAQLFIITPESLTGVKNATAAGEKTREMFEQYPVGGFIYFGNNLLSSEQVTAMLSNVQQYSMERMELPAFTCVDEEGGTVTRISGTGRFDVPNIENMSVIGESGNVKEAYAAGSQIGAYLSELGFNVDFAPVADVLSNPDNTVVKFRSFGSDPDVTADMSLAVCQGMQENNVLAVLKHYPGHGATEGDSHQGYAYTMKSLEELQECELVPFQRGIDEDISFIMAGHISVPNVTGDDMPATLSKTMITEVLRERMGYQGIVITDGMNMGAITQNYSSAQAAVNALLAGVDMILMPKDFYEAYHGVLEAVNRGEVPQERVDEAVRRILSVKLNMAL